MYDIYTGLRLDEAQVKAGRETEVKRMLEFDVCEEVSEEVDRGKRIWNSAWLESRKKKSGEVKIGDQSSPRCMQARRRVCGRTTTRSNAFHVVPCCV